jgi:pyruvate dehydrogenase E2 component (dihydrolipoamide acetyltransferase)
MMRTAIAEPYQTIALSPLRRVIASRMMEAQRTIPHFHLTQEIELDALLAHREALRSGNPAFRLSLNDFFIKICATALVDVPSVNLQWVDDEIRQYRTADIAVVTAVEGGLLTPIVRNADSKSVFEISREVKELTVRAGKNALKMSEITGGSFSLSNLGMHGVDEFDAVINPPQCAILAVGTAKPRAVVSQRGSLRAATTVRVTLSADHRAIDGVAGARFLAALRRGLEHPE